MMCQEGKQFTAVFLVLNTFLGSTLVFRKFLLSKTFRRRQYNLPLSWKFKLGSYVWTKQVLNISVSSLWSTWIFVAAIQFLTEPWAKCTVRCSQVGQKNLGMASYIFHFLLTTHICFCPENWNEIMRYSEVSNSIQLHFDENLVSCFLFLLLQNSPSVTDIT